MSGWLVEEVHPVPAVMAAVRAFRDVPRLMLFDSARRQQDQGRYSFLTADPDFALSWQHAEYGCDPFQALPALPTPAVSPSAWAGLPPFRGGWAGLLSYELAACWERLPRAAHDEFQLPVWSVGWYSWVLAWDHEQQRAWFIGWDSLQRSARERYRELIQRLQQLSAAEHTEAPLPRRSWSWSVQRTRAREDLVAVPVTWPETAQQVFSNVSTEEYLQGVARVIEYIRAGDIFQANFTQRLLWPWSGDVVELYARLRQQNPAPHAGLLWTDDWAVLSASPEQFLRVQHDEVMTRPIKGTRRRCSLAEADLFTRDELRDSVKDAAENVMIVDLLRNDLSRVCRAGSVWVPRLCAVETLATVQHLVSEVRGRLREGCTAWDVLRAAFPGGSITGAPKIRAMHILAELEPTVRGPYTGSLFYLSCDGALDSNILIRTLVAREGWLQCGVGGGVTVRSVPHEEYQESWHKAAGLLRPLLDESV
ncbi:MAG: para-aminobenzoate synthase [Planctomycetaceae bacterium]|nr:MAG: para-aminobenzoate synthase [Planctomycetaceae bacterium]